MRFGRPILLGFVAATLGADAAAETWRVVSVDGRASVGEPEISFAPDGAIFGSTGCNRLQARGAMQDGKLVIDGPAATTRMACPGEALAAQEDAIVALLNGTIAVTFDPFGDALSLANGEMTLTLVRAAALQYSHPKTHAGLEPPAGEPPYLSAFGISGRLEVRRGPSADAEVLGAVDPGTVLRNAGCAETDGARWCEVAVLDGTLVGWAEAGPLEAADNVLRAGQRVFDAAGLIPCAKGTGTPMTQCPFGVARDAGGNATVVVSLPDDLTRLLVFADGALLSAHTGEADGGHEVSSAREGDLTLIRVNDERYEIPDAVVHGG